MLAPQCVYKAIQQHVDRLDLLGRELSNLERGRGSIDNPGQQTNVPFIDEGTVTTHAFANARSTAAVPACRVAAMCSRTSCSIRFSRACPVSFVIIAHLSHPMIRGSTRPLNGYPSSARVQRAAEKSE